jgi:serine/threonine protein kinase
MDPVETRDFAPALGQLGRYQLQDELGHGAMGTVHLARDTHLDRQVAIKVLPPHCTNDPGAVARFRREAKALARLSHPAIVQAYDAGEAGDKHFLVMEYVEGTSLAAVLRDKGRLPPTQAADYIYQAAGGLEHAHSRGLVHRDLKPSNLLLTARGRVKILDLGLARFLQDQIEDPSLTRENTGLGTPDYAAPEQFRNAHDVDARADIYALGCTLYHLITGRVPFPGSSLSEKCEGHEHQEPPAVEDLCPEVPAGLALAIRRMMAKQPAQRFQTAGEVADALAPYVAGSSAVFPSLQSTATWHGSRLTVREFQHGRRRRRWVFTGAAAALGLAALAGAWFYFYAEPAGDSDQGVVEAAKKVSQSAPGLLTVSKNPRNGGQYRSLKDALAHARPGATIRVLDDATYSEAIVLDRADRHRGIVLEAPKRATIALPSSSGQGLVIQGVPRVRVTGFRFRSPSVLRLVNFISVLSHCPGVVLSDLDIQVNTPIARAIVLQNVRIAPAEEPLVVTRCFIRIEGDTHCDGITVTGPSGSATSVPSGGIAIRDNRIQRAMRGILIQGKVCNTQVTGNLLWQCEQSALQIQDLEPNSRQILIANNTAFKNLCGFRVWSNPPFREYERGQVEVSNNLCFQSDMADMGFILGSKAGMGTPGDGRSLLRLWRFTHNWRDLSGDGSTSLPCAPGDKVLRDIALPSDPGKPDFLRPANKSPLATGGAGPEDPSLPAYVGAVPPQRARAWDWAKTWRDRIRPARARGTERSGKSSPAEKKASAKR